MEHFGYLLVHFVEDPGSHAEQVYFTLSDGDDPLRWHRINGGRPVLSSTIGTTGVRDPHLVRTPSGSFHIVATDLRVWRPGGPDWDEFQREGSRSIIVWDSEDLVGWGPARSVEVAPASAGMAWAPESFLDPATGEHVVHFASKLHGEDGPGAAPAAQLLVTRTRDFQTFTPAEPYLSLPHGVIDLTLVTHRGRTHRFAKQDDAAPDSWRVFHQVGDDGLAGGFQTLATELGREFGDAVEGPLVFRANHEERWYLWVDRYGGHRHGYRALTTTDLPSGQWQVVPEEQFQLPPNTKHGSVLPLVGDGWARLAGAFSGPDASLPTTTTNRPTGHPHQPIN